jgi:DNA polymerase III delta prime subunit
MSLNGSLAEEYPANPVLNPLLEALACSPDLPHLLIEGYRGSGKKTQVWQFLTRKYGPFVMDSVKVQLELDDGDDLTVPALISRYHHQINPTIHGVHDQTLVQALVRYVASCQPISGLTYRTIVLEEADKLSINAQESLRRTMETQIRTCRFILISNREGYLIPPIRSRCLLVRRFSPTAEEMISHLEPIYATCVKDSNAEVITELVRRADHSWERGYQLLEKLILYRRYPSVLLQILPDNDGQTVPPSLCDTTLARQCLGLAKRLTKKTAAEQSSASKSVPELPPAMMSSRQSGIPDLSAAVETYRENLYQMLNYGLDAKDILTSLNEQTLNQVPDAKRRYEIAKIAAQIDERLRLYSSKAVYHLEQYCVYVLAHLSR